MSKVFVVGISDCESNSVASIHKSYSGALEGWHKERRRLIWEAADMVEFLETTEMCPCNTWRKQIESLSCEDPEAIENYPHYVPYICEMPLEE